MRRLRILSAMKAYYFDSQCTNTLTPAALDLEHLAGLYIILAVGCALSLIASAAAVFWKKLKLRTQRYVIQRQDPFHFSENYVARIVKILEMGVLLRIYRSEKDEKRDSEGKKPDFLPVQYSM